jgi:hypothetical protein
MLSLAECVALSDLTDDEVAIIAEHERVPAMVAVAIGQEWLRTPRGVFRLKGFICDALERAKLSGDRQKTRHLERVLTRFNKDHPVPSVL